MGAGGWWKWRKREGGGVELKPTTEVKEAAERGRNVGAVLALVRHGRRTDAANQSDATGTVFEKRGALTHEGRAEARMTAIHQVLRPGSAYAIDFDHIYVTGSTAGPVGQDMSGIPNDMQRAYETAHIHGQTMRQLGKGRIIGRGASDALSYATLKTDAPYDHEAVYSAALKQAEEDGKSPTDAEVFAQTEAIKAEFAPLSSPDAAVRENALVFFKEVAGSFAVGILELEKKMKEMRSGETLFLPAGTHGGTMECLLAMALEWDDEKGVHHGPGLSDITEIGGAFMTSEGYNIEMETDYDGQLSEVRVNFHAREKRKGIYNATLNVDTLREMAEFYRSIHSEMPKVGLEELDV